MITHSVFTPRGTPEITKQILANLLGSLNDEFFDSNVTLNDYVYEIVRSFQAISAS